MARRNCLVEGLSGSGKSSVYEELIRRSHWAITTDRSWRYGAEQSTWDEVRAVQELERPDPAALFVCGSSRNRDRFLPYFATVINLVVDDDTMRRRLAARTNNDYGKQAGELELVLALNRRGEKPDGAVDVDATRPLDVVVDDVLRLAGSPSPAPHVPWARGDGEIVESRVMDASGDIVRRVEYGWSGDVLAALLSYLEANDVALVPDRLTPADRRRCLPALDPIAFDPAALRVHYERRNRVSAPRVDYAMLDGVAFLRDTLEALEPGFVAVIAA